jgi:hypothetical protein
MTIDLLVALPWGALVLGSTALLFYGFANRRNKKASQQRAFLKESQTARIMAGRARTEAAKQRLKQNFKNQEAQESEERKPTS